MSKQILSGDWDLDRVSLTDTSKNDELSLEWHLGVKATGLEINEKNITLDNNTSLSFDGLVIATGARCISLKMAEHLEGVYTLRGLDDAIGIRKEFEANPHKVVVVGAGFIGAEVAATAKQRGLDVTMIEAAEVPFERVLGPVMGNGTANVHRDHGVEVITGLAVEAFQGTERVEKVILEDGTEIEADLVIVGIGVRPNTEWLEGSGLTLDNGVLCDETCEAAPGIVAAGDVARWPNKLFNENMRVEHWDNAVEQGVFAARRLLAGVSNQESYTPTPWFWTDQFDRKIQLAGRTRSTDDIKVVTGSIEERRFATAYGREGKLVGILGFNRPRHVMQYKQLIADGASWDDALAFANEQAS